MREVKSEPVDSVRANFKISLEVAASEETVAPTKKLPLCESTTLSLELGLVLLLMWIIGKDLDPLGIKV